MRIKRQRKKLRGKYSGNCLACAAKWSKCWYIASLENQAEWESRLNKPVTPADDEVCFQCWDAKIRTSPKRKLHYKAELPEVEDIIHSADGGYPLRPSKRVNRNKRRALNEDYDVNDSDLYDSKGSSEASEEEEYYVDENHARMGSSRLYKESTILDEENAVMLLSTAFHSIPQDIIDGGYHVDGIAYNEDDDMTKRRGVYFSGRCGNHQTGHACDDVSPPTTPDQTPSPSSSPDSPPPLVMLPRHHHQHPVSPSTLHVFQSSQSVGIISALLSQPIAGS